MKRTYIKAELEYITLKTEDIMSLSTGTISINMAGDGFEEGDTFKSMFG